MVTFALGLCHLVRFRSAKEWQAMIDEIFSSFAEFKKWNAEDDPAQRVNFQQEILDNWLRSDSSEFIIDGWCDACSSHSQFVLDRLYSDIQPEQNFRPNWRERLVCTGCGLNCRMRASFALLKPILKKNSRIWINEQTTQFYRFLSERYTQIIGSEYGGPDIKSGDNISGQIRHEDCTNSSHDSNSLSAVLSFDVMEHLPDFESAIAEAFRVLTTGGVFFWSAPFDINQYDTSVRAIRLFDGSIVNIQKPIFHGDPMNSSEGILCFQTFGWDVIDRMLGAGFRTAEVYLIWSQYRVILGNPQPFFCAKK